VALDFYNNYNIIRNIKRAHKKTKIKNKKIKRERF